MNKLDTIPEDGSIYEPAKDDKISLGTIIAAIVIIVLIGILVFA